MNYSIYLRYFKQHVIISVFFFFLPRGHSGPTSLPMAVVATQMGPKKEPPPPPPPRPYRTHTRSSSLDLNRLGKYHCIFKLQKYFKSLYLHKNYCFMYRLFIVLHIHQSRKCFRKGSTYLMSYTLSL